MAKRTIVESGKLIEELKDSLTALQNENPHLVEGLIERVIRLLGRLSKYNREFGSDFYRLVLDLKNILDSEKELQKMTGKSSQMAFGDSFFKSLNILREEVLLLLKKIS